MKKKPSAALITLSRSDTKKPDKVRLSGPPSAVAHVLRFFKLGMIANEAGLDETTIEALKRSAEEKVTKRIILPGDLH